MIDERPPRRAASTLSEAREASASCARGTQKYPEPRSALLMALHLVQAETGHVPIGVQREVAALLGSAADRGAGGRVLLPDVPRAPGRQRHIQVCVNIACALARRAQAGARARGASSACAPARSPPTARYSIEEVAVPRLVRHRAVCVQVNNQPFIENVTTRTAISTTSLRSGAADDGARRLPPAARRQPTGESLDAYRQAGGYEAARAGAATSMTQRGASRKSRPPVCAAAAAPASAPA